MKGKRRPLYIRDAGVMILATRPREARPRINRWRIMNQALPELWYQSLRKGGIDTQLSCTQARLTRTARRSSSATI
jgi:hypothetical protein